MRSLSGCPHRGGSRGDRLGLSGYLRGTCWDPGRVNETRASGSCWTAERTWKWSLTALDALDHSGTNYRGREIVFAMARVKQTSCQSLARHYAMSISSPVTSPEFAKRVHSRVLRSDAVLILTHTRYRVDHHVADLRSTPDAPGIDVDTVAIPDVDRASVDTASCLPIARAACAQLVRRCGIVGSALDPQR